MLEGLRWRRRLAEARALFEAERRLLLRGAVGELARLDPRRRAAAAALAGMPEAAARAETAAIGALRRAAERNAALLAAYRDGAADALARLRALDARRGEIGAYRPDGSKMNPAGGGPTRERRA